MYKTARVYPPPKLPIVSSGALNSTQSLTHFGYDIFLNIPILVSALFQYIINPVDLLHSFLEPHMMCSASNQQCIWECLFPHKVALITILYNDKRRVQPFLAYMYVQILCRFTFIILHETVFAYYLYHWTCYLESLMSKWYYLLNAMINSCDTLSSLPQLLPCVKQLVISVSGLSITCGCLAGTVFVYM